MVLLSSCLGPRPFDLDRGMLKLNWDHNLIYQLWTPWQDFCLQNRFAGLPLLECTRVALSSSAPAQVLLEQGTGWRCLLFTDGSAKEGQSGWAVAIVLDNQETHQHLPVGFFGAAIDAANAELSFREPSGDSFARSASYGHFCGSCSQIWVLVKPFL